MHSDPPAPGSLINQNTGVIGFVAINGQRGLSSPDSRSSVSIVVCVTVWNWSCSIRSWSRKFEGCRSSTSSLRADYMKIRRVNVPLVPWTQFWFCFLPFAAEGDSLFVTGMCSISLLLKSLVKSVHCPDLSPHLDCVHWFPPLLWSNWPRPLEGICHVIIKRLWCILIIILIIWYIFLFVLPLKKIREKEMKLIKHIARHPGKNVL